jgi:hypothetical protein
MNNMYGIFTKSLMFNSNDLRDIKNEIIFEELSVELEKMNIKVKYILSINKDDSWCMNSNHKVVPTLSLYINDYTIFEKYGIDGDNSNWNGKFYLTNNIINIWKKLCIKNSINKNYYSDNMFFSLRHVVSPG